MSELTPVAWKKNQVEKNHGTGRMPKNRYENGEKKEITGRKHK